MKLEGFLWDLYSLILIETSIDTLLNAEAKDGWNFYLWLIILFSVSGATIFRFATRQMDPRFLGSVLGAAMAMVMFVPLQLYYSKIFFDPLSIVVGLWGAYIGFRYLSMPVMKIYSKKPTEDIK
ncbi:MAG: hypothetical protein ACSHXB_04805 [Sulfitobacter sp.]